LPTPKRKTSLKIAQKPRIVYRKILASRSRSDGGSVHVSLSLVTLRPEGEADMIVGSATGMPSPPLEAFQQQEN
jgi:hypothetical protein